MVARRFRKPNKDFKENPSSQDPLPRGIDSRVLIFVALISEYKPKSS
jgi:hypothetical protein